MPVQPLRPLPFTVRGLVGMGVLSLAIPLAASAGPGAKRPPSAGRPASRQGAVSARTPDQVLRDAREALGGDARLRAVKGLVVEGSMLSILGGRENWQSYGFRMLLPDRFQMTDNTFGHTLDGADYWRIEDAAGAAPSTEAVLLAARRATQSRFFVETLRFLLQTPPSFEVQVGEAPTGGAAGLEGDAIEWRRKDTRSPLVVVFDRKTHRPTAMVTTSTRSNPSTGEEFAVSDVTSLQDYRPVDGIQFPFTLDRRLGDDLRVVTRIQTIIVNPALGPQDFKKPAR